MKSRFYDGHKLEGNFMDLDYGSYSEAHLNNLLPNGIRSVNVARHTIMTLYSLNNFLGKRHVVSNPSNKSLKVTCFDRDFGNYVRSVKIENTYKKDINDKIDYNVIKDEFIRDNTNIAYTFYNVIPTSRKTIPESVIPSNSLVAIIPDLGAERQIYKPMQFHLAQKRFSSVVLDLRGVGQSGFSDKAKYSDIIEDYRYIIKELGQFRKKPILIGHGFGGAIAQNWALSYKLELKNLVLINSAPHAVFSLHNQLNTHTQQWLLDGIDDEKYANLLVDAKYNSHSEETEISKLKSDFVESFKASDSTTLKRLLTQNPEDHTLVDSPKHILTPTLILHGAQDAFVAQSGSEALSSLIRNSKYVKINTGHSPFLTAPQRTHEVISKFLLQ
jgi:pimeloyl-ACP methyl ester carboxylesterase